MAQATHKAWRWHAKGDFRLDEVETPAPAANGVIVRIEAAMVLSYMNKVLDGSLGYALPPAPFVPGTNAVGVVEAAGAAVLHLRPGDRVFLSPHLVADERAADPAQILIGLTATGTSRFDGVQSASVTLQTLWRDGVFTEKAHWPAATATSLAGLGDVPPERALGLAKLVVPYGGLLRGRLQPGDTLIVNGASGYFGAAGVMVGLAMGAARIVAAGRDRAVLEKLAARLGPRVAPAVLSGEAQADIEALTAAAGGRADMALDLLGQASSTTATLSTLRALRRGGRLVLMGSAGVPLPLTFGEMLSNDWEVIGAFMYPKDAPAKLVKLVEAKLLDLSPIDIKRYGFTDLPAAIEGAARMRGLDMTAITL
ncbi:alcohol dehydrogenase [Rhizobiales bacterium GAS113]|nr:alcohol dehydrogenase [Rhizobiales bacterium GAS113]